MACSWFAHYLYITYSWPAHVDGLFLNCSLTVHELFMTCSNFVYFILMTPQYLVNYIFMTCTWVVHDLFVNCSGHQVVNRERKFIDTLWKNVIRLTWSANIVKGGIDLCKFLYEIVMTSLLLVHVLLLVHHDLFMTCSMHVQDFKSRKEVYKFQQVLLQWKNCK